MPATRPATDTTVVYQFRITLKRIEPTIWRTIEVPESYSFWDLHVAINDAMGWLDYHLHVFTAQRAGKPALRIGIPDDEWGEIDDPQTPTTSPGWNVPIYKYLTRPGDRMDYEYDFGDCWDHSVVLESISLAKTNQPLPRCTGGERACPPEDCGGTQGYNELVASLQTPGSDAYAEIKYWLSEGHAKVYWPYDPDHFAPTHVRFYDPQERFNKAFVEH